MWPVWRRNKRSSAPFPPEWRQIIEAACPFYARLPAAGRSELEERVQTFLAEKNFEGCDGLVIQDEHRLCIAAHACLLLLHRDVKTYPDLHTVLVYPNTYVATTMRHIGSGVMEEIRQPRAGESWREGAVVLTWDAIVFARQNPESGHNVILHEFAHQLDFEDGHADGVPLLGRHESLPVRHRRYTNWGRVMRKEYEQLRAQVRRGEETVLRDYGATSPAEFFAVATECFFGKPRTLREKHPELYDELKRYYQQDPAEWGSF